MEIFTTELRSKQTSYSPGVIQANTQTGPNKFAQTPNDTKTQDINKTAIITPTPSQQLPPLPNHKQTGHNQKREALRRRRDRKCSTTNVVRKRKSYGLWAVRRKYRKTKSTKKNTATNLMNCFGNETMIDKVGEGGDDEVDDGGDEDEVDGGGDDEVDGGEVDNGGDDKKDDGSDDEVDGGGGDEVDGGGDDKVDGGGERLAAKIWADEDAMDRFDDTRAALRYGIALYYSTTLNAPARNEWGGQSGTISHICDVFKLPSKKRRVVRRILDDLRWCEQRKAKFNGKDKRQHNKGRPVVIVPGSSDESIIADWMECNLGFRNTLIMVNTHRVEEGRQPVGRNAIMNAFDRMNPLIDKIDKVPQGSTHHEGWREARRNQTKQFLVMLGEISKDDLMREYPAGIPRAFDPDHLPTLTRNQVVFYDETHIEQEGGLTNSTGYQIRFPRDSDGNYLPPPASPSSATDASPVYAPLQSKVVFKYPGQSRLCLGVAAIKQIDGTVLGVKSKIFDYTAKRLISIQEWRRRINDEIKRVKGLKTNGKGSRWVGASDRQNKDEYWANDAIEYLPRVGRKGTLINTLLSDAGITTIADLAAASPSDLGHIRGIHQLHALTSAAKPGSCPNHSGVDHRLADNPYESKYKESWMNHIRQSTALKPFRPITDLVDFMMKESKALMANTVHANDWFFYHDALSLLTSKECRQYMENTYFDGIRAYDKWLIPTKDVNVGTKYNGRCVGNSPEFMPLDNSLNNDLQVSHRYHCAVTAHLPKDDPRKHTLATPKRITDGLKKIWENPVGAPNPERVVEDVNRAFDAFKTVYEADGNIVKGLANRNGHRNTKEGSLKWGGSRVKKSIIKEEKWLEPGAKDAFEDKKTFLKSKFLENLGF